MRNKEASLLEGWVGMDQRDSTAVCTSALALCYTEMLFWARMSEGYQMERGVRMLDGPSLTGGRGGGRKGGRREG